MPRPERKPALVLDVSIFALVVSVFVADLVAPLGFAVWVLYVVPLALCLLARRPSVPIAAAAVATIQLAVGFFLSPSESSVLSWVARYNRPLAVVAIWSVAIVVRRVILARAALQREQWLQGGLTALAERLRGEHAPATIAERALGTIAAHTGAAVALLYGAEGDTLTRLAARAVSKDGDRGQVVRFGEGIVGQVAADGKPVVLSDLPPDYLKVASGLGEATPRHVIVAPISAEGRVNGVIELGFLDPAGDPELELCARVAETLGMALRSAFYRHERELLLEETQRQAEELEAQRADLRAINEELEEQGRSLREVNEHLAGKQAELEQHAAALEAQRRELLAAQETLARASRYKSEFLANMSHELRTPLNSALILARLLADDRDGNLTAEQVRFAETIHHAGLDLLALIEDVLDLSKIEAGRVEAQPEALRVGPLVESLRRAFAPVAEEKKLAFRVEVADDAPKRLTTDPRRLEQILKNLLSNAFKFTERGEVALVVRAERDGRVGFLVEDTGIGVAEAQQALIFEAFRQADGTTSRKYGGTGLGLSISRELARLLGGDVTIESTEGRGSRFQLTIPAELAPVTPSALRAGAPLPLPARAPVDPMPRKLRRVLLVEDDEGQRAAITALLAADGVEIVGASTAHEALARLGEGTFDCVVLDLTLPDAAGHELLEKMAEGERYAFPPVIVHTGRDLDHDDEVRLRRYAPSIIVKGAKSPERLRDEVTLFLHRVEASPPQERRRPLDRAKSRDAAFEGRHILLVEDDVRSIFALSRLIEPRGAKLEIARNGREALEIVDRGAPLDLVLMDVMMPEMDGLTATREIRKRDGRAKLPILALTAKAMPDDHERCIAAGADDYLAKPVDADRLLSLCRVWLGP